MGDGKAHTSTGRISGLLWASFCFDFARKSVVEGRRVALGGRRSLKKKKTREDEFAVQQLISNAVISTDIVDITWDPSACQWDIAPQNDCDLLDVGSVFTIFPDPSNSEKSGTPIRFSAEGI